MSHGRRRLSVLELVRFCKLVRTASSLIKAKPDALHWGRSKNLPGIFVLGLVVLIFISLELPQLLGLNHAPRGSALEDYDWNSEMTLDLKRRPQARELKAEEDLLQEQWPDGIDQVVRNSNQPELDQTESIGDDGNDDWTNEEQEPADQGISSSRTDVSENSTNPKDQVAFRERQSTNLKESISYTKVGALRKAAHLAWKAGRRAWKELESVSSNAEYMPPPATRSRVFCPKSIFKENLGIEETQQFIPFPCGLTVGSSITVVGKPRPPHFEYKPSIGRIRDDGSPSSEVSHFVMELHGQKESKSEEPPRILHINPRLKGDWSDKQVIELNSCYNGQWGKSQRCDGTPAHYNQQVDGLLQCEKWLHGDQKGVESSWWLHRLVGRMEKPEINWPFPFIPDRLFILTLRAGLEGYHMSVDGRHITSFPYTTGLLEEDTAGIFVSGDVDLQSIIATSLPALPPKAEDNQVFENWNLWRAPKVREGPIELFIGVLSTSNHFAERMAVRSTWFQMEPIKSAEVVARFFVAMHRDRDINMQMKKEAEYYGDMVILPFIDEYQLVVLKTIAICEYGVRNVSTKYIMKVDDDTFVRVDAVLKELKMVGQAENLYLGNMNMFHRPLRTGKWAVTFEEWPDEEYPTYANGPAYIISRKIASFIVSQNRKRALELFKMEDVSLALWVKQFHHMSGSVQYVHSWKFYQAGCENGYITAHYQAPRQMVCMWKKLLKGEIRCCNSNG